MDPPADHLAEIRQARESNEASETVVPTTFVDDAELVWNLTETFTQEQTAKAMGWSRPLVAQYAQLKKIDEQAWAVVVTSFAELVTGPDDEAVTDGVTTVTKSPFTERLLREILDLDAAQQTRLCKWLAKGRDQKGHGFGKADFKTKAGWFRGGNALRALAKDRLESKIPPEAVADYLKSISAELDANDEYTDEYVALKVPGAKFGRLIQSAIDDWEKKNNIRVIVKDIRALSADDIPDESIDCIITDPPYPKEYVDLFGDLGALAARVLKPGLPRRQFPFFNLSGEVILPVAPEAGEDVISLVAPLPFNLLIGTLPLSFPAVIQELGRGSGRHFADNLGGARPA